MYTTNTPALTERQFRETAAQFYRRLKTVLKHAGTYCRGGKTALSWRGGCVELIDRSGEKCHPWRVRVMWNDFQHRSWVAAYQHVLELGAPDEPALLGMVLELAYFLTGGRNEMWMLARYHPRGHDVGPVARALAFLPSRRIVPLRSHRTAPD
jgi:hypothetical protein